MVIFPFFAILFSQVFAKEFSWMKNFAPESYAQNLMKRGIFEEKRSLGKF